MPPAVHELLLPEDVAPEAVASVLAERYAVAPGSERTQDKALLDSFDGLLRAEEMFLERLDDATLRLSCPDGAILTAPAPTARAGDDFVRVSELPEGPLRARLAPVLEVRAALALARVRSRTQPLPVLNEDGKTVVRLTVERPQLRRGGESTALTPRLRVGGVRGYDEDLAAVLSLLRGPLGLDAAPVVLFDEAVTAAGHPPRGVSTKVSVPLTRGSRTDVATLEICRALAGVAEANLPGTLDDIDAEFLHDLRVSVRRTRSMLREMKGVLPPAERDVAREDLKWIQQITGPTRDLDVHLEEWPQMVAGLEPAVIADLEPIRVLLERRRAEALHDMRRSLRGARYRKAWARWRELIDRPLPAADDEQRPNAPRPVEEVAGGRIRSVYAKMIKEGSAIGADSPAEALHDLRKRGKELRYLLELFGSLWPSSQVKPLVAALKDLQEVLGRFQDREVQVGYLRAAGTEITSEPGGADALIALGRVLDRLSADQHAAREEFGASFASFAAKATRRTVRETFA